MDRRVGELGEEDTLSGRVASDPASASPAPHGSADGLVTRLQRSALKSRMFATPPTIFVGRYVVLRHLGRGGMGDVFAAYDPQLDRKVALKLLRSDDAADEEGRARLLREAQAMARLAHPNVVAVHDVGLDHDRVFIAMELVDGVTLRAWLERSPPWREALRVMRAVGRGVAAAHAVGIVHRDLKPDNVMVGDDGRVRVMDFGLARPVASLPTDGEAGSTEPGMSPDVPALALAITDAGKVAGTPAYMGPEHFLGEDPDERGDQFSYAVVLWEALHGERPFQGDTLAALRANVLAGRRSTPTRDPGIPRWLRAVLDRALAVQPARRFESMEALLAAIAAGERHVRRRRVGFVGVGVLAVGVAGLGAREVVRRRALARCEAEGDAISEVWNDDASARLRDALLATGVEGAADAHARAVPWLDRFADAWRSGRAEACKAATLHESSTADLYARARECFDERRDALAGLLEGFADADGSALWRLVPAVAGFEGVVQCADPVVLARRRPPGDAPKSAELRHDLGRATGLGLAGRYAESTRIATATAEAAIAAEDEALAARAWTVAGRNAEKAGDLDASEAALSRALDLAGRLGLDAVAADAATEMVYTIGVEREQHDAAIAWGTAAQVFVAQLGEEEEIRGATLLGHLGTVRWSRGDWDEARKLHEHALAIKERILGPEHPSVAISLLNLANPLNERAEWDEAERLYRRALEIFETQLGPQHPGVAACANNLGSLAAARGRYEEAIELHRRALDVRVAAFGEDHASNASILNNLGNAYYELGHLDEARAFQERGLELRRKSLGADHPDVAMSLANLAKVERAAGRYDRALELHDEALAIRERALGPGHPDVIDSLVSLGYLHQVMRELDEARAFYERAQALAEKVHGPSHPEVAAALAGLANVDDLQGDPEAAIPRLERALEIRVRAGMSGQWTASARYGLARALSSAGRDPARARELATQARDELRAVAPIEEDRRAEIEAWLAANGEVAP